jgi:hypothetical protein
MISRRLSRYRYFKVLAALPILVLMASAGATWGAENPCSYSGYLWGTGAQSSFEVYSDSEELRVFFTWPSGTSDFRVKVTDNNGVEGLSDRSLSEGDLFTLTGPGIFHFEIYSKWGGGCWKATVKKIK